MNQFINAMRYDAHAKTTENGAYALDTTFSPLLDLFGTIGGLRNSATVLADLVKEAWNCNQELTLKMLFYARDCRGGLGEREVFKNAMKTLEKLPGGTSAILRNMHSIAEFGRWDDLYTFISDDFCAKVKDEAWRLIRVRFYADYRAMQEKRYTDISLLAKWMKSVNASSKETIELGKKTAKALNLTERRYRQIISKLRKHINIVEQKMSANEWTDINYEHVPSKAMNTYSNAFGRHDSEGFGQYMEKVNEGSAKINAATLFPYDLIKKYRQADEYNETIEAQWKALPEYCCDKNFLIMSDVSGSMECNHCIPLDTSIGLGIYFAQRTKGIFKNLIMTFESDPHFVDIATCTNLYDAYTKVLRADWGGSTNLEAAFEKILNMAVKNHIPQSDMPDALVVITDMEIDGYCSFGGFDTTFTTTMKKKFAEAGYTMPTIVWWNVNARANTFHAEETDDVRFVSGLSPSIFEGLCKNLGFSATELMLNTLNNERYRDIH